MSDTFHVSGGGQTIGENYNIQVMIKDDNAVHYLKKSGLVFDYLSDGNSFPTNMASLFSGLELSIGGVTISTPFQAQYVQQKISRLSKK